MLRHLMAVSSVLPFCRTARLAFGLSQTTQSSENVEEKKEYMKLFSTSIEWVVKKPNQTVLANIRSRNVTRIMAENLKGNMEGIFEADIECLYALVNRREPSIEAITIQVYTQLYKLAMDIEKQSQEDPEMIALLRPTLISKLVKISQSIDVFYNEAFRTMMAGFLVNLLSVSAHQSQLMSARRADIVKEASLLHSSKTGDVAQADQKSLQDDKQLKLWLKTQFDKAKREILVVDQLDYWNGVQLVLGMGYYTDEFLLEVVKGFKQTTKEAIGKHSIDLVILKIRALVSLHKFNLVRKMADDISLVTRNVYQPLLDRYFHLLRDQTVIFETVNSDETIIQTGLVTQFLNDQQHERARVQYMRLFTNIFDTSRNGVLLVDIKRLKGIFEVVLIMCGSKDTKEVHELLRQVEKTMLLYPIQKFLHLDMHVYVCDRFGFRSDVFAERYFKFLLEQKEKLDKFRGVVHGIHQTARDLILARKFLIYLKLGVRLSREKQEQASGLASSLFDSSFWYALGDLEQSTFVSSASYSHFIYFIKAGLYNLTCGSVERRRIESMAGKMGLKNVSRDYLKVLSDIKQANNRFFLKLDHNSCWLNNPQARIITIFELAVNHFDYVKRKSTEDSQSFMAKFMGKTINNPFFYGILKQRLFGPGMFDLFLEFVGRAGSSISPTIAKDIEGLKQTYVSQIVKAVGKYKGESYQIGQQSHLQFLEHNKVNMPTFYDGYGANGMEASAVQSVLFHLARRLLKEKESIRRQIETYFKFRKEGVVNVAINYMEYPYLADLKVSINSETVVLMLRLKGKTELSQLGQKVVDMEREAQIYWKGKGYSVVQVTNEEEIELLMGNRKRKTGRNY